MSIVFVLFSVLGWLFCAIGIAALSATLQPSTFHVGNTIWLAMLLALLITIINSYARTIFANSELAGLKFVCTLSAFLSWFLITIGFVVWALGHVVILGASNSPFEFTTRFNVIEAIRGFKTEDYIWLGIAAVLSVLIAACPMLASYARNRPRRRWWQFGKREPGV